MLRSIQELPWGPLNVGVSSSRTFKTRMPWAEARSKTVSHISDTPFGYPESIFRIQISTQHHWAVWKAVEQAIKTAKLAFDVLARPQVHRNQQDLGVPEIQEFSGHVFISRHVDEIEWVVNHNYLYTGPHRRPRGALACGIPHPFNRLAVTLEEKR